MVKKLGNAILDYSFNNKFIILININQAKENFDRLSFQMSFYERKFKIFWQIFIQILSKRAYNYLQY